MIYIHVMIYFALDDVKTLLNFHDSVDDAYSYRLICMASQRFASRDRVKGLNCTRIPPTRVAMTSIDAKSSLHIQIR